MFKRIIAATDLVLTPDPPVLAAAGLARQEQASLLLLHIMESASTEDRRRVRHFETNEELMAYPAYEAAVRQQLETTYQNELSDVAYEVCVCCGFPWQEILARARRIDCDLIVLGPHSSRAEERGVVRIVGRVGSTVENVITREGCPVMIVNRSMPQPDLSFRRLLVGIDFSSSCECAVRFAATMASHYPCAIFLMHMIPVPPYPKYSRDNYEADLHHARQRLVSLCDRYLEGVEHHYLIRAGALPHLELIKCAGQNSVDVIILGSHTKEREGKWYPGSVVERVSYRAACPVLAITDPEVLLRWGGDGRPDERKDHLIHVFTGN